MPASRLAQLRDPDFARLFAARSISSFGSAMAPVALAFGVLERTSSATAVGLVIAAQAAAQVALQLAGGALADRGSRQRQIVRADLLAAASQSAVAILFVAGSGSVALLCALVAVTGASFALHWPAAVGLVPQVVPRERLQEANALLSLAQSAAMGLGGACGGVAVAVAGAGAALALDAATFLASAWLVAGIRPRARARGAPASLLRDLREGWREFTAHRWLWVIVAQFSLVVAAWNGGFLVIGPVVAARALGGAGAWAVVAGALGLGLLAGGALALRLPVRRPMRAATLCVFTFALPLALLTGPAPLAAIAAGAFLAGVGSELFSVLWNTALHTHVAPASLSRVSSFDILGSIALAPLGAAAAGPLADALGTGPALWLAAALIAAPTAAALCVPEVRRLGAAPDGR